MIKLNLSLGAHAIWRSWWQSSRPLTINRLGEALRAVAKQGRRGPDHWEGSRPDDFDKGWDAAMDWVASIAAEMDSVARISEEI